MHDLQVRIWDKSEDPDSLLTYVVGDEVDKTIASAGSNVVKIWWRTRVSFRALLDPATREQVRQRQAIQRLLHSSEDEPMEEDDFSNSDGVLAISIETFVRYRPMLLAIIAYDAKNPTYIGEQLAAGEMILLKQVAIGLRHSRVLLEDCVTCLFGE